jgi:hypothetical protein
MATCAAGILLIVSATTTLAAKPNHQACLGETASAAAGPDLGPLVSGIASTTPQGAGDEVQAVLAGVVPDEIMPNACN